MSSENKMSKQNIITFAVAGVALLMALVVILVKVGVFEKKEEVTAPELGSTIVVASETMENGEVVYYTMLDYYEKPHVSSFYVYPTKEKPSTAETTTNPFVEETKYVQVTNEDGIPLLDEYGVPITKLEKYTVSANQTTTEEQTTVYVPETKVVQVTDKLHRVKKDENGNPVTEIYIVDPNETTPPTTKKVDISKEEGTASSIISNINSTRAEQGLPALSVSSDLKALASTKSMSMVYPELYGKISLPSASYTFKTASSGGDLYNSVIASAGDSALSQDLTEIGVAVIRFEDTYYTTVIFR